MSFLSPSKKVKDTWNKITLFCFINQEKKTFFLAFFVTFLLVFFSVNDLCSYFAIAKSITGFFKVV